MQVFFMKDGIFIDNPGHTVLSNGYCEEAFAVTAAVNRYRRVFYGSGFLFYSIDNCSPKSSAWGIAPAAGRDLVR